MFALRPQYFLRAGELRNPSTRGHSLLIGLGDEEITGR